MATLSGLAIGLSFLVGCVLLGLVAELYYHLWWKKRLTNGNREIEEEDHNTKITPIFSYFSCWEKPISVNIVKTQGELQTPSLGISSDANGNEQDLELGLGKDLLVKEYEEESVEAELMRLHNLCGPPRFLFTINEETKEDLESEDGKSIRGDLSRKGSRKKNLGDLVTLDSPFLTPLPSSPLKGSHCYNQGFNPLFESSTDAEINKLKASPPPTFKFLRDAEEKLLKRLMEEAEKRAIGFQDPVKKSSLVSIGQTPEKLKEEESSFVRFIVGKSKEGDDAVHHQLSHYPSTPSQVLPLASSPSAIRPFDQKSRERLIRRHVYGQKLVGDGLTHDMDLVERVNGFAPSRRSGTSSFPLLSRSVSSVRPSPTKLPHPYVCSPIPIAPLLYGASWGNHFCE